MYPKRLADSCYGSHAGSCPFVSQLSPDRFAFQNYGDDQGVYIQATARRIPASKTPSQFVDTFVFCEYGRQCIQRYNPPICRSSEEARVNHMHKAYSFRLYPTKEQEQQIRRTIGCCRFVFNHFLARRKKAYEQDGTTLNQYACMRELPALKQQCPWLQEVDSTALQRTVEELDDAFQRFFREKKGYPRFKSKKHPKQSYTSKRNGKDDDKATIRIEGNRIRLPKLGWVKFAKSRDVQGRIISVTVRRNPAGKYFVSVLVETEIQPCLPVTAR